MSRTLAIIKPDAVEGRKVGKILDRLESEGFTVLAGRFLRLSEPEAGAFYEVHRERPFYDSLCRFMSSGPLLVLALERENAVRHLRQVIGATDPADAEEATIRALYAESKERNAIHASDSDRTARQELAFFFGERELLSH